MPLLLFAHLFLTVAAVVIGKSAREALLLPALSPVALTALDAATLAAVLTVFALQLRRGAGGRAPRLLVLSPICFAVGDLALAPLCAQASGLATGLLAYVWLGVQGSFSTAYAAVLVNAPAIRSRRGAAMAGAGAMLGWIGGGVATHVAATTAGAVSLVLMVGLLTLLTAGLVAVAVHRTGRKGAVPACIVQESAPQEMPARVLCRSPHLRLVAGLTLCSAAASSIATFQFRSAAVLSLANADELAVFLGSLQAAAGIAALAVQLIAASLLGRLGRGMDLMLAPAVMLIASIGVCWSGTLASVVLLRGTDQVLRYSFDRTARERVYAAVPPAEVFDGRTFIETAIWRLGDVAGTLIALAAILLVRVPFTWLSVPVMLLAVACLALAFGSRRL